MKKLIMILALMMPVMAFAEVLKGDSTGLSKQVMFTSIKQMVESGKGSFVTYSLKSADLDDGEILIAWEKKNCTGWGTHWVGHLNGVVQVELVDKNYSINSMDGTVSYNLNAEYDNLSAVSAESRKTMLADMANVHKIFKDEKSFNTSTLEYQNTFTTEKLAKTPKYLKPKDEEKGKVNPEYAECSLMQVAYAGMYNDLNACLKSVVADVIAAIKSAE